VLLLIAVRAMGSADRQGALIAERT
jgi:hypothetical protein